MATINGTAGNDTRTGTGGDDILYGHAGNDTLDGGGGNDTLYGGTGIDLMRGGSGNDVYIVGEAGDRIVEATGAGIDEVRAFVSHTLGANLENLTLSGSAALTGTGNGLNNVIAGNDAANLLRGMGGNDSLDGGFGADTLDGGTGGDRLVGGDGNDRLIGGEGTDRAVFRGNAGDYAISSVDGTVIVRDLRPDAGGDDGIDTLTGIERLVFNDMNLTVPEALTRTLTTDEDETLSGRLAATGPDGSTGFTYALSEGGGPAHGTIQVKSDGTFTYTPSADYSGLDGFTYTVTAPGGIATSRTVTIDVVPVPEISLGWSGEWPYPAMHGEASPIAHVIGDLPGRYSFTFEWGDSSPANIALLGISAPPDYFPGPVGGVGEKHFYANGIFHGAVTVSDPGGKTASESFTVWRQDTAQSVSMTAGSGTAALISGTGNDTLVGGASANFLDGDAGDDRLYGDGGGDVLFGGGGNDVLDAGAGADLVRAGAGDDVLVGGSGADELFGDAGRDRFLFGKGHGNDRVHFVAGEDILDLSQFGTTHSYVQAHTTMTAIDGGPVNDCVIDLTGIGGGRIELLNVSFQAVSAGIVFV